VLGPNRYSSDELLEPLINFAAGFSTDTMALWVIPIVMGFFIAYRDDVSMTIQWSIGERKQIAPLD
jgi:hypothetical protein